MPKINQYFDGDVVSIGFQSATLPATVGVMKQGEYEFSTSSNENMQVISGELSILMQGEDSWRNYIDGQCFEVKSGCSFKVKALGDTAYLCTYWS